MIRDSRVLMTVFDVAILASSIYSIIIFYKYRSTTDKFGLEEPIRKILVGLILISLFYLADLYTIHVLPAFMSLSEADSVNLNLHLHWSWLVSLLCVGLITVGLSQLVAQLIPELHHTFCRLQQAQKEVDCLNFELENKVKQRTQELASVNEKLQKEIIDRQETQLALHYSESRAKRLEEGLPIIIYSFSSKKGGIYYSKYVETILGYSLKDFKSNPWLWHERIHPEDRQKVHEMIQNPKKKKNFEMEYRIKDSSGNWHWFFDRSIRYRVKKLENEIMIEGLAIDITERKKAQEALEEAKEQYQNILNNTLECFWIIDGNDGRILEVNDAYCQTIGYTREELLQMSFEDVKVVENYNEMEQYIHNINTANLDRFETKHRCKNGDLIHLEVSINYIASNNVFFSFMRDITFRKEMEEKLVHNALHDDLTGLPNRILFVEYVDRALFNIQRNPDHLFAVMFIDLDRFKIINDSLGHLFGDLLLIEVGKRLEKCIKNTDIVARLGGDEFTILIDNFHNIKEVTIIAEKIREELSLPFNLKNKQVFTSASVGIALSSTGYKNSTEILRDADLSMYHAKKRGKSRYEIFDPAMHAQISSFLELENALRKALENKEFSIDYQPIICLKTDQLAGFEALIRWQHPSKGLISPIQFIPIAEETGIIIAIGDWILSESCRQMRRWQEQFDLTESLTISVNLSGKQLQQSNFIDKLDQILRETGLNPHNLKLELTETMLLDRNQTISKLLKQFKERNIQIGLDDFGTGYSALSYLQHFPIDTLKIDKSFVSNMRETGENLEIVKTIINLAHNLGMDVIAEGIETQYQLNYLKQLNCEFGQGYWFDKPLNNVKAMTKIAEMVKA